MKRWFKYTLEAIAALAGIAMIAAMLLVWRLSAEPLSTDRLTPYLEQKLAELAPGSTAKIGATLLAWDNAALDVTLRASEVELMDDRQQPILSIPELTLRFRPSRLMLGRILPQSVEATRPQLTLTRLPSGKLVLGQATDTPPAEAEQQPEIRQALINALDDLAHHALLNAVDIHQASVLVRDSGTRQEFAYSIPEIKLQDSPEGLNGTATLEIIHQNTPTQAIVHYDYRRSDDTHGLTLRLADFNPAGIARQFGPLEALRQLDAPITGEMTVRVAHDLTLRFMQGQFDIGAGIITNSDLWDEPRSLKSAALKLEYDAAGTNIVEAKAALDFNGPTIALTLTGQPGSYSRDNIVYDLSYSLNIKLANLPMNDFTKVWPKPVVKNAREWIVANMSAGLFKQGEVKLRGLISSEDLGATTLDDYTGSIEASNATVRYIDGMPPVTNANASGVFDFEKMDIAISGGGIGAIRIQPFTIRLDDFQRHPQVAKIPLKISGPVPDVLRLLNAPRLRYAEKIGIKPDTTNGTIEGTVNFEFPMLKDIDLGTMAIKAEANLKSFSAQKVAANFDLSEASLKLDLDNNGVHLQGPASVNKVPLTLDYRYAFAPAANDPLYQAVLQGSVLGQHWKQLGLDLPVIITGPAEAKATIAQMANRPVTIRGEVNFRQAVVDVALLNWQKPVGNPAQLTVQAEIPVKGPIAIKSLNLRGAGVNAQGSLTISSNGGTLLSADIKPLQVGRTNASLHYERTIGPNPRVNLAMVGESFDLSGYLSHSASSPKADAKTTPDPDPARQYVVQLDRLYTTTTDYLANLRGRAVRDMSGWQDIDLQALANGSEPIVVRLGQNGTQPRALNVACNDFGLMLKALGLTNSVEGGKLEIRGLTESDNPSALNGTITLSSFSVGDLPVLVRLLNAISPLGFADLLTGRSTFDRLRGKFTLDDDAVTLRNLRIAGPTYGMTLEGKVDLRSEQANLNGTLIPFSFVSNILNKIPVIGDIITGGEGQGVFAVAYTIQGPLDNLSTNVNPVSALMPGFVRNVFFAGDEE